MTWVLPHMQMARGHYSMFPVMTLSHLTVTITPVMKSGRWNAELVGLPTSHLLQELHHLLTITNTTSLVYEEVLEINSLLSDK